MGATNAGARPEYPILTLYARDQRPGEPFDMTWYGWVADSPDPGGMLGGMIENSAAYPTFNDPSYQRRLAGAEMLTGPARYLAFGKLDVDVARNDAPLLAYGNSSISDFFSASPASTSPRSAPSGGPGRDTPIAQGGIGRDGIQKRSRYETRITSSSDHLVARRNVPLGEGLDERRALNEWLEVAVLGGVQPLR
jgi:hypothetical protein